MSASTDPLLRMRGIVKRFPGVLALDAVDFEVRAGEVHALMGQNGAGKSTLIRILTGVVAPDAGNMRFEGREFRAHSPADAQRRGISTIYQEVNLIPSLSVAENLFLGRAPRRWWGIDYNAVRKRARALLAEFDLELDVDRNLDSYSIAIQQMISIARAVDVDARLLVMDEPTSSLDAHETALLFKWISRLKARGMGIVFITHFLDQVYRVSDRITVLRNGRRAGVFSASELPKAELVGHMIGRPPGIDATMTESGHPDGKDESHNAVLEARRLGRRGHIAPFDLHINQGEVLGFAGLLGSGRTEAARLLFGADRADAGIVRVFGREVVLNSPRKAIARRIAMTPEERKTDGIFPEMSVLDNITLVVQRRLSRLGLVSRRKKAAIAQDFVRRLGIVLSDPDQPVKSLSGGNQQKVLLARWLALEPLLLILDEPTRGIDVGAKAEIESLIARLSTEGKSVLFISAELDEVVRQSDRIAVFRDRRLVGELSGDRINEQAVMDLIAGSDRDAA